MSYEADVSVTTDKDGETTVRQDGQTIAIVSRDGVPLPPAAFEVAVPAFSPLRSGRVMSGQQVMDIMLANPMESETKADETPSTAPSAPAAEAAATPAPEAPAPVMQLDASVRKQLTCPVCNTLMMGRIFQCTNGHPICEQCHSNARDQGFKCECGSQLALAVRCLVLEAIRECVSLSCRYAGCTHMSPNVAAWHAHDKICEKGVCACINSKDGCPEVMHPDHMEAHALLCSYGKYKCFLCSATEGTDIMVSKASRFTHLNEKHDAAIKLEAYNKPIGRCIRIDLSAKHTVCFVMTPEGDIVEFLGTRGDGALWLSVRSHAGVPLRCQTRVTMQTHVGETVMVIDERVRHIQTKSDLNIATPTVGIPKLTGLEQLPAAEQTWRNPTPTLLALPGTYIRVSYTLSPIPATEAEGKTPLEQMMKTIAAARAQRPLHNAALMSTWRF